MSERAGLTNKGKDGKTKYSSLNLYDTYKGDTTKPQRPTVSHGRGLQSLGKVGSSRRVPPPAVLPSLRSESGGNDPNVNLVPEGGAGWKSKDNRDTSSPPVHAPVVSHQVAPRPVQNPGGLITIQPSDVQQKTQSAQSNLTEPGNAKSWGSVIGKDGKKVGIHGYKPQDFQEEFPSLGAKELQAQLLQKTEQHQQKPSATNTEQQYGPGPSLRPQNVGNWKDGGGSLNKSSANDSDTKGSEDQEKEMPSMSVRQMSINGGAQLAQVPHPSATPQLRPRGMMPPYAYGRFPTTGPGANYPGNFHPMMPQPPPAFNHYPDKRMPAPNRSAPNRRDDAQRPAIISERTLMQLDNLENDLDDSGWAGAPKEVDYGEKLVFSDDECHPGNKLKHERKAEPDTSIRNEDGSRCTQQERGPLKSNRDRDERPQPPGERGPLKSNRDRDERPQPPGERGPLKSNRDRDERPQPPGERGPLKSNRDRDERPQPPGERGPLKSNRDRDERPQPPRQAWSQPKEIASVLKQTVVPVMNQPQGMTPPLPIHPNRQPTPMPQQRWHLQRMPTSSYEARVAPGQFNRFMNPRIPGGHHRMPTPLQTGHAQPVTQRPATVSSDSEHMANIVGKQPPTSPPLPTPAPSATPAPQPTLKPVHPSQAQIQPLDEEDVVWHQQRHKQCENMTNAIERARQRREDDTRSAEEERKAAAQEKLRALEEKIARRKVEPVASSTLSDEDTVPKPSAADPVKRQRTESESSDGSRQGGTRGNSGYTAGGGYSSRSTAKNLPPRFQKQEMMRQQEQQLQGTANRNLKQAHGQIDQRSQRTGPPPIAAFVAEPRVQPCPADRSFNQRRRQDSQGSDRQSREDEDSAACVQRPYQRRISGDREAPDENKRPVRIVKDTLERGRTTFSQTDGVESEYVADRIPPRGESRHEHWKPENDVRKTEEPFIDMETSDKAVINIVDDCKNETKQVVQPISKPDQIYSQGDGARDSYDKQEESRHSFVKRSGHGRYPNQRDDGKYGGQKDHRRYVEQKENIRHGQQKDSSRYTQQKEGKRNEQKDGGRQTDGKYSKRYSNSRETGRNSDSKSRYSESQPTAESKFVEKPWKPEHTEVVDPAKNTEIKGSNHAVDHTEQLETPSHNLIQNEKSKLSRGNEKLENNDLLDGHAEKTRRRDSQKRKPKELVDSSRRKDRLNETKGMPIIPVLKSFTVDKGKNELPEKRIERNSAPTSAWTKPLAGVAPAVDVVKSINENSVEVNSKVDHQEDQKAPEAAAPEQSKTGFKDGAGDDYKGRYNRDRGQRKENDKRKDNYRGDERKVFDGRRVKRDYYPTRGHGRELGNRGRGRFDPSNKSHGRSFGPTTKSRGRGDRGKRPTRDGNHFNSYSGTKRTDESRPEMYTDLGTKVNVNKMQDEAAAEEHSTVSDNKRMTEPRHKQDNDDHEPQQEANVNKRMIEQRHKQSNLDNDNHQPQQETKFRDRKEASHHDSRRNDGRRFDDSKPSRRTDSARRGRGGSNRGRGRPVRYSSNSTRTYSNEHYDDDSQYIKRSDKNNVYKEDDDNKRVNHGRRFDRRSVSKDDDEQRKSSRYDRRTPDHRRRPKPERPPRFQKNAGKPRGQDNETFAKPVSGNVEPVVSYEEITAETAAVKPSLTHQNSSDQNNEDWETASESSEFSDKNRKDKENQQAAINVDLNDRVEPIDPKDSIPVKKSFLNQRPVNEKTTRRSNTEFRTDNRNSHRRDQRVSRGSGHSNRGEPRRTGSSFSKSNKRNGVKTTNNHHNNPNPVNVVDRQHQSVLYRLDDITLNSPQGVTNALTDATSKVSVTKKSQDSKPKMFADKKRDVLADFDLNNYAGVVIIDNNPEVIVEDPNDLMTPDEGFQEVMSKQTRKKKAQQEEERKKQETSFTEAVIKKPKLGTNMKIRQGKVQKSSPIKDMNGKPGLSKSPTLKASDNVQATNFTTNAFQGTANLACKTTQVNAWSKPLAVTLTPGMRNTVATDGVVKGEAEQHDSGIELNSDHQASTQSSQTSSPTGDVKGESTSGDLLEHVNDKIRQQKSKETGIGGTASNYSMDKPAQQDLVKFSTSYDPGMSSNKQDTVDTNSIFSNEKQLTSKFPEESLDSSGRNHQLDQFEEHVRTNQNHQTASRNIVQSHPNSKTRIIGQPSSVVSSQSQVGKQPTNALSTTELPHSMTLTQAQVALAREPIEMPKSSESSDTVMKHQEASDSKPLQMPHTMHRELQINTQSPNSPATDELTKSIKSTKKLWESRQSLAESTLSPGNSSISAQSQAVSAPPTVQISSSADFTEFQRRQHVGEGISLGSQSGVTFGSFGTEGDLGESSDITNQEPHTSSVSAASSETFVSFNGPTLTGQHQQSGNSYMVATGYATGLSAFSTATNNLPFPSVVLTNTMETKPIGGNIQKGPAVGFNPSMMISNSAQHTPFGSVIRAGNASPNLLAQGPASQVAAFQRGDAARMIGSGVTLTGPSIASVIQHQPSTNYQYGIGQTHHTIAPSPPAQQPFAPVGFITSQQQQQPQQNPLQQANLGVLSQPLPSSSLANQTFLGFSSLGFSQGLENPSNTSLIGKPSQPGASNLASVSKPVSSLQFNSVPNVNMQQPTQIYAQRPTTPVASQQNLIGSTLIPAIQRNIQQTQQQSSFFATNNPVGSMQPSNTYFSSLQAPTNSLQQQTVQALPLQLAPTNQYQYHSQPPANIHQSTTNMSMPTTSMFGNLHTPQNSFSRAMTQLPVSSTTSNTFSASVDKKMEFLANHSMITPHTSERNLSQRFGERPGMPGRMIIEQNRSNIPISDLQQHVDAKPFNPIKRNEMPFQHNMSCPSNRMAMKSAFGNVPSSSSFITPSNTDGSLQQIHQPDIPMRYISASTNNVALQKGMQNKNIFALSSNPNTSMASVSTASSLSAVAPKQQAANPSQSMQVVVQHPNARLHSKVDGHTNRGGISASAGVSRFPNPLITHKTFGSSVGGSMFPVGNPGNVNSFHQPAAAAHQQQPGPTHSNTIPRQTNQPSAPVAHAPNLTRKVVNGKMSSNYSTRPPASKPYEKLSGDALKAKQDKEKAALLASTRAFFNDMNQTKSSAPAAKETADSTIPQPNAS